MKWVLILLALNAEAGAPFNLDQLPESLRASAEVVYSGPGRLLKAAAREFPKDADARELKLFVMNAVKPLFRQLTAKRFNDDFVPPFEAALAKYNAKFGVDALTDFCRTDGAIAIARRLLAEGVDELMNWTQDEQVQARLQRALRETRAGEEISGKDALEADLAVWMAPPRTRALSGWVAGWLGFLEQCGEAPLHR